MTITTIMTKTTTAETAEALARLNADGAWVVGGAIRDALAGCAADPFDLDIAVPQAASWARDAGGALGSRAVRISAQFNVWRIALPGGRIDVWELADGEIEPDLRRRDFKVNAMAVPLEQFRCGRIAADLIDPCGGRGDIAARRLRLVSDGALRDDPVRMLRAVRLEAEAGWRLDAGARAAMRRDAAALDRAAAERRWDELRRVFVSDRLPWALRRMERSGLLDAVFPELTHCRAVEQRPVHRRDVFWHQIDAVRWLVRLTSRSQPRGRRSGAIWGELAPLLASADIRRALDAWRLPLRLATLLHDVGKPDTRTVEAAGATRFLGHSELGAQLAADRLRRLRVPERVIAQVGLLIEQHLRPGQVHAPGQPPTDRALYRFHAVLGEAAAPLCWLFLADSLATAGAAALQPRWSAYAAHVARIATWTPSRAGRSAPILDGHGIMDAAGLPPGPHVGQIRAKIDEAAAIGQVSSVEQARRLARQLAADIRLGARGSRRDRSGAR